jgi:hypothetical protein
MVVAEHPDPVGQVVDDDLEALAPLARGHLRDAEVAGHGQRAGVLRAQHGPAAGQCLLELRHGLAEAAHREQRRTLVVARDGFVDVHPASPLSRVRGLLLDHPPGVCRLVGRRPRRGHPAPGVRFDRIEVARAGRVHGGSDPSEYGAGPDVLRGESSGWPIDR